MKKLFTILIAAATITSTAKAQDAATPVVVEEFVTIGAKIGVNFSNVYSTQGNNFTADSKIGFAAGGFLTIPITRLFAVQAEVLFSQKGFHGKGNLLGAPYDVTRTTNYLDVPIFLAFRPIESITLLAGPQYSYLMKQTDVFTNGTTSIEQEKVFSNDNLRRNTLCFVAGVDVNLNRIVLGVRAGWDVMNNNGDGSSSTPRYKNEWLQATIGYRF